MKDLVFLLLNIFSWRATQSNKNKKQVLARTLVLDHIKLLEFVCMADFFNIRLFRSKSNLL